MSVYVGNHLYSKEQVKGSLHLPMGISMSVSLNKTKHEKGGLLGKMEALMMDNG